jgi:hypothetical protein
MAPSQFTQQQQSNRKLLVIIALANNPEIYFTSRRNLEN